MIERTYLYTTLRRLEWFRNRLDIALKAMNPDKAKVHATRRTPSEDYLFQYAIDVELSDDMERFLPVIDMIMQENF